MAFEKIEELRQAIDRVFGLFSRADRGDVIARDDMENVAGYKWQEVGGRFRYIVKEARKRLLKELGIATRPVPGVGVKLLANDEQVSRCFADQTRRAFRSFGRGKKEVDAVDPGSLSDHMRELRFMASADMKEQRKASRASLKKAAAYTKTETMPLRKQMA